MKSNKIIQETVDRFGHAFENIKAKSEEEMKVILARYSAAIQPNFVQWLASSISAAKSDKAREILRKNLCDEVEQDHPGMLKRFCDSAGVRISPTDVEMSVQDLYHLSGDVFDRGYATSVRKLAALAVMENASPIFIPRLEFYAKTLGSKDFEYTQVHGIADIEHAHELVEALNYEIETQVSAKQKIGFCESAAQLGADHSAECLINILSSDRTKYVHLDK